MTMIRVVYLIAILIPPLLLFSQVETLTEDDFVIQHFTMDDGLPSNIVYSCVKDNNGYLWLATEGGLSRFDGKHFVNYGIKDGLTDNLVFGVEKFDDKIFAISFKGIDVFSSEGQKLNNIHSISLPDPKFVLKVDSVIEVYNNNKRCILKYNDDTPTYITLDRSGNNSIKLPLGKKMHSFVSNVGAEKFLFQSSRMMPHKPTKWYLMSNAFELLDSITISIGNSYYGYSLNLNKIFLVNNYIINEYDCSSLFKLIKKVKLREGSKIHNLFELDKDYLYLATTKGNGFFLYKKKKYSLEYIENINRIEELRRYNPHIKSYQKKDNASFYIGTHRGISELNTRNGKSFYIDSSFFTRVYSIYSNNDSLIYSGTLNGVFETNRNKQTNKTRKVKIDKIVDNSKINSIAKDKNGNYWISVAGEGVYIVDDEFKVVEKNLEKHLLFNSLNIDNIVIDGKNRKWLSSSRAILVFDGQTKYVINKKNGLYASVIKYLEVKGDTAYIFYEKGCQRYIYSLDTATSYIPFYFNSYKVNNNELDHISSNLDPDQDKIEIGFIGIYYSDPTDIYYKYRLMKNSENTDWDTTHNTSLIFEKLSHGDYELQIKAFNANCPNIHSGVKTMKFSIKPYYYNTWWFWMLISFIAISFVFCIILYRNKKESEKLILEKDLQSKINKFRLQSLQGQMNPHFIFNAMSTIQNLVLNEDKRKSIDFISEFSYLMRKMLGNSRKEVINLEDEIEFLKQYTDIEQIRYENSFDVKYENKVEDSSDVMIPTMLVQPLVENAIKHGVSNLLDRKGEIVIRFELVSNEEFLIATVSDNGKGKNTSMKSNIHQSSALDIIRERLKIYNLNERYGSLEIKYKERGTESIIKIPI